MAHPLAERQGWAETGVMSGMSPAIGVDIKAGEATGNTPPDLHRVVGGFLRVFSGVTSWIASERVIDGGTPAKISADTATGEIC